MVAEDCLRRKKQVFFHLSPHLHSVENVAILFALPLQNIILVQFRKVILNV